jgi:hypothetical protein
MKKINYQAKIKYYTEYINLLIRKECALLEISESKNWIQRYKARLKLDMINAKIERLILGAEIEAKMGYLDEYRSRLGLPTYMDSINNEPNEA